MASGNARVHILMQGSSLEIEGSESFVKEQLERLEPILKQAVGGGAFHQGVQGAGAAQLPNPPKNQQAADGNALGAYPNLFALADEKIQILKDLPGSNKAQKSVSAALLLALANTLRGQDATSYDAIRGLCAAHACLDSTNFSKTLKAEKELFLIAGTPKNQSVRLSVPGRKRAEELAASLNAT